MFIILFIRVFFTSVNKRTPRSLYKYISYVSFHYVYNNNLHYSEEKDKNTTFIRNENSDDNIFFNFQAHFSRCTNTIWKLRKKSRAETMIQYGRDIDEKHC